LTQRLNRSIIVPSYEKTDNTACGSCWSLAVLQTVYPNLSIILSKLTPC